MTLTQIQINSLKSLFAPMDKHELNESLKILMDESLKRDWEVFSEGEINSVTIQQEQSRVLEE